MNKIDEQIDVQAVCKRYATIFNDIQMASRRYAYDTQTFSKGYAKWDASAMKNEMKNAMLLKNFDQ